MAKNQNCIFCKIIKGESPSQKVAESNNFIAIKNINPIAEGHTLILTKKHFVTFLDLPNNLGEELVKITKQVIEILIDKNLAEGFNLGMNNLEVAGQVVMHFHLHVIPRKEGDGIKLIK